jgi:transposase
LSIKSDQLEWRRNKVIELRTTGLSYQEIAHELQVSKASITSDVQYLREQAKGTIKEYVTEHLLDNTSQTNVWLHLWHLHLLHMSP